MNTITVLSVSTGDRSLLTAGAAEALRATRQIVLRTSRHPAAAWLEENKLSFESLDTLYEHAETFDTFNQSAAEYIIQAAETDDVVYAVADVALDSTVSALLISVENREQIRILPGVGHADRCLALAKASAQDLRLSSAEAFLHADDLNPNTSAFCLNCTAKPARVNAS